MATQETPVYCSLVQTDGDEGFIEYRTINNDKVATYTPAERILNIRNVIHHGVPEDVVYTLLAPQFVIELGSSTSMPHEHAHDLNAIVSATQASHDRLVRLREYTARLEGVPTEDMKSIRISSQNASLYGAYTEAFHKARILGEQMIARGQATVAEVHLAKNANVTFL
jgi:hypothetical protein